MNGGALFSWQVVIVVTLIIHLIVTLGTIAWVYLTVTRMHAESWVILQMVKEWAQSAHIQAAECTLTVQGARAAEQTALTQAQLRSTLEEFLDVAADRIAVRLRG